MVNATILTVTTDKAFLSDLRRQLREQVGTGSRMIVTDTIDEACDLMNAAHPQIVVVHCADESECYEQIDRLLWATSVLARRIPVLVIAERYGIEQATMLFRMGVSEYISRTNHLDQIGQVFTAYLPRCTAPAALAAKANGDAGQPASLPMSDRFSRSIVSQVV